jgi:hypothetical protein
MSRSVYDSTRAVLLSLCQLKLPAWSTIRRAQAQVRAKLDIELQIATSVWGTPCVSLGVKSIIKKVNVFYSRSQLIFL